MSFSNLNADSAALRVCVNEATPDHIAGQVYSQRLTAPMPFSDLGTLLLRLDQVLDIQNFPQAFQRVRSFTPKESKVPAAPSPEEGLSPRLVEAQQGTAATFVLHILSRRSSSWQGSLDWLDGSPRQEFTSVLELMKLIEERL